MDDRTGRVRRTMWADGPGHGVDLEDETHSPARLQVSSWGDASGNGASDRSTAAP